MEAEPVEAEEPSLLETATHGESEVVVLLKDQEVMRVPLTAEDMIIGRDKTCQIHLDDRALSRKHAKLERRGASLWVQDLGSANGTYVNGAEIQAPTRLDGGDVIGVGHYSIIVEGLEEADEDTPVLTLDGPEGLHRFALVGEQVVIGRAQTCDIAIGHKSISRRHMRIEMRDGKFFVEDLGSQNGVKIHGKRIKKQTEFKPGELLEIVEFKISVGFLSEIEDHEGTGTEGGGRPNKPRTMLIDRSILANAAYVDGDLDEHGGGVGLGGEGEDDDSGESEIMSQPTGPKAQKKASPKKRRA